MDISKQRVGGFPQGNVETALNLGGTQMPDEKLHAVIKCEIHLK
jgi:hypothetical protein